MVPPPLIHDVGQITLKDRDGGDEAGMLPVIFTDLDASLLDHNGYGFSGAMPALRQIKNRRIPLIAVTSKCRPEVDQIQKELGIEDPFIVENGAALFVPKGYRGIIFNGGMEQGIHTVFRWGLPYQKIRAAFAAARHKFPIKGFGDMNVTQVAQLTGLSTEKAVLARQREFSEPFVMEDPARFRELETWAAARNLAIVRGGRFFHLIGSGQDKGRAVSYLTDVFRQTMGEPLVTIGIGDSPNDESMLTVVDVPVLMPQADGTVTDLQISGLIIGSRPGSHGWNEVVLRILNSIAEKAVKS